jgi:energy-coupling factor transporter ATP-binding protein EcfA2
MAQYIYTMNRVSQGRAAEAAHPEDISLSFFPGAKIGVLGLNGSGKSTLLRIMAGVDRTSTARRGRSPASHRLPAAGAGARSGQDVRRQRRRGRRRRRDQGRAHALQRDQRRSSPSRWRRRDERAARGAGKLQDKIDAAGRLGLERSSRSPPTRCACRRGTRRSASCPAARSAASRCAAAAVEARHAAARRADQPPRRRIGRLARAFLEEYPAPSSRSPTTATSSTTSPAGSSSSTAATASRGRATTRPGSSRRRSASSRRRSQQEGCSKRDEAELEWVRRTRRRARPRARRACSASRSCSRRNSRSATRRTRSTSRRASASATSSSRRQHLARASATGC